MNALNSPLGIKVLLDCHTTPEPIKNWDAPAVNETIRMLFDCGAIEVQAPDHEGFIGPNIIYRTTPMGKAWVAALCYLPAPTTAFIDQMGRVIEL